MDSSSNCDLLESEPAVAMVVTYRHRANYGEEIVAEHASLRRRNFANGTVLARLK